MPIVEPQTFVRFFAIHQPSIMLLADAGRFESDEIINCILDRHYCG